MHIVTGNEKLCKIYFKNLFFQNVFGFIYLFIDTIISFISSTQIACDVCVYNMYRSSHRRCSLKKVFLKILLISHENTSVGVSCLNKVVDPQACNCIKKRLQHRCVLVKLAKFYEHLF